jgi:hypothetical protein
VDADPAPTWHRRRTRLLAIAVGGGPVAFAVGGILAPAIHDDGLATIQANVAANPVLNQAHLAAFLIGSFLLPVGAVGLAQLAYGRSPALASIGGFLGVIGWIPLSALTALDDLAAAMSGLPSSGSYAHLLDRFTNDWLMVTFLVVYIIGHLLAYVLLGIALHRAGTLPTWAATCMVASSPMTMAVFLVPGRPVWLGELALCLLAVACLRAAAVLRS